MENALSYARNQTNAITGSADFIGRFRAGLRVNGEGGQGVPDIDCEGRFYLFQG